MVREAALGATVGGDDIDLRVAVAACVEGDPVGSRNSEHLEAMGYYGRSR